MLPEWSPIQVGARPNVASLSWLLTCAMPYELVVVMCRRGKKSYKTYLAIASSINWNDYALNTN